MKFCVMIDELKVETRLGHVLIRSSGSEPVYKISMSDPDSALEYAYNNGI